MRGLQHVRNQLVLSFVSWHALFTRFPSIHGRGVELHLLAAVLATPYCYKLMN